MFGEILRNERKAKKMTLRELSKELDISFSALGKYERGDNVPDITTLIKIANYFDLSVDYILGLSNLKRINGVTMISHEKEMFEKIKELSPTEQNIIVEIINSINLLLEQSLYFKKNNKFDIDILESYSQILDELWRLNSSIYDVLEHSKKSTSNNSQQNLKNTVKLIYFESKCILDKLYLELSSKYLLKFDDENK